MKALAGLIVSGRWQAVAVTAASGVLSFLLPPFSSLLTYLAAAAVALVTLHVGVLPGLQVLLLAATFTVVFYQLAGLLAAEILVTVALLWLPAWLLALVLRQSRELGTTLKAAALFGLCLLAVVYGVFGDPAPWWVERLKEFQGLLEESGISVPGLADTQLLQEAAALMTGVLLASLVLGVICSVLLARWWQSVLLRPGAFGEEFCSLRLGHGAGLLTLGTMLMTRLTQGTPSEFAAQAAMMMLVPYLLAGLAVIHSLVRTRGRGNGWLVVTYVILTFVPQAMLLLAGAGLLDTWIDFRRRLGRGENTTGQ
ncbi:MAG: hypothetical protein PVJ66_02080 [Gammaproteobacteria bacterium]